MPLSVHTTPESLASGFALVGVHKDEVVCKNRLFFTFCLLLMNLFKGRWRTGLYTLTHSSSPVCVWEIQTAPNTGLDTEQIKLTYKVACATHKQQCGHCRLAAILSFPLLKTTPLYLSTYTGFKLRLHIFPCLSLHLRHTICRGLKTKREY